MTLIPSCKTKFKRLQVTFGGEVKYPSRTPLPSVTLLSLAIAICGLVAFVMERRYNQRNTFVDVLLHRLAARFSKEVDYLHAW
jgi:hypothetical protein